MAKSSSNKRKTVEYSRYGYFFIAPFFIVFAIFQLWPLIYTMGLAFCENYTDTMFNVEVTVWPISKRFLSEMTVVCSIPIQSAHWETPLSCG